jgi:hypothetical protein
LAFYIAAGFRPFREEDILVDDPRLTGLLPRTAAPHVPLADVFEPGAGGAGICSTRQDKTEAG